MIGATLWALALPPKVEVKTAKAKSTEPLGMMIAAATRLFTALTISAAIALPAAAHQTIKAVDDTMLERETYFQPMGGVEPPKFSLADADGKPVQSSDFKGKVVVLNFVYTNCTDVCPVHSQKIADIQSKINETPMKDMVQFVTVTTDPVKDDAGVMRAFPEWHGLDTSNWVFLTRKPGEPEDATRKLAKEFGVMFTPSDDGEVQTHAAVTYILDREGRLAAKFHGLEFETVNAVIYINGLINVGKHVPGDDGWWARLKATFN